MDRCPNCGKIIENFNLEFCTGCGNKLDFCPSEALVLTDEEQKRIAEEKAERARKQEIEKKEMFLRDERKRKEREEMKRKLKKIILIASTAAAAAAIIFIAITTVCKIQDGKNEALAKGALQNGDYETAIEYYKKTVPFGSKHGEYIEMAVKAAEGGEFYKKAKSDYENYSYVSAMNNACLAIEKCPDLLAANEVYTNAQSSLAKYLKGKLDSGEYEAAAQALNLIKDEYKNEEINSVEQSINDIIADYVERGRAAFNNNDTAAATVFANSALALNSENQNAKQLISDTESYIEYAGYMEEASTEYNNGNCEAAADIYHKVPDNEIGSKVIANYSLLAANIDNYEEYKYEPVRLTDKDSTGRKTDHYRSNITITFTLENRLNRPVDVEVKGSAGGSVGYSDEKYETFHLNANETRSAYIYFSDVFTYYTTLYQYNAYISDFTIK